MANKLFTLGVVTNIDSKEPSVIMKVAAIPAGHAIFYNDGFTFSFDYKKPVVTVSWGWDRKLTKKECKRFGLDAGIAFSS